MSTPSCSMLGETCSPTPAGDRHFPAGLCRWCGWTVCSMGCGTMVRAAGERCEFCHPLACPCEDCVAYEALPDSDGVPAEVDEEVSGEQTVETRTLSDAELLALLDTMVDLREAA